MSQSTSGALEHGAAGEQHNGRRGCTWGKSRWTGWEIGAIVLGFVIFWPIGLIALFWKLVKGELWPGSADGGAPWANWRGFDTSKWRWRDDFHFRGHSGNSAFEAYKARELEKLEQLRRKLAEDQKAFGEFLNRLKRAKDQEEFDRFMAERNQKTGQ